VTHNYVDMLAPCMVGAYCGLFVESCLLVRGNCGSLLGKMMYQW
jgi:hypothetical protein